MHVYACSCSQHAVPYYIIWMLPVMLGVAMPAHHRRLGLIGAALGGRAAAPGQGQACTACLAAAEPTEQQHKIVRVEVRH